MKPALHPRSFLQKAHFAVRQAADDGQMSIGVEQVEKLFTDTGIEASASSAGGPENYDTY